MTPWYVRLSLPIRQDIKRWFYTTESEELALVKCMCFVVLQDKDRQAARIIGAETLKETDIKN